MALTSSSCSSCSSPNVILLKSGLSQSLKPLSSSTLLFIKPKKFHLKKSHSLQIRSSIKNKVFEDQSEGVICYTDENGEIICEGYDEGPRFQQQQYLPEIVNHQKERETEIFDLLLKQSWFHLGKVGDKDVAVKEEDLNLNGFNNSFANQ